MKSKGIFALDLGTTKFCLARTQLTKGEQVPTIETLTVEAMGMHKGMLSNFSEAKIALNKLIEMGEDRFKTDISRVVVGVAGSHLKGFLSSVNNDINANIVKPPLVAQMKKDVMDKNIYSDRELLHTIPLAYKIDDRSWTACPVGFSGSNLQGQYFLIDADKSYLSDMVRLCNESGLEVVRLIAEPYASASVTGGSESRKIGVVVADIGGGTTDGIIFQASKPISSFTINIGGKLMTKDLSIGLGISSAEAEKVKREFGLFPENSGKEIIVNNVNNESIAITWRDVYRILGPRISELGHHISKEISPFTGSLGGGILLTGGGSNVKNISSYMTKDMGINVDTVVPGTDNLLQCGLVKPNIRIQNLSAKYSTVSGLLNIHYFLEKEKYRSGKSTIAGKYFSNFVNWIKELS